MRAIDTSGNPSAWLRLGNLVSFCITLGGTMAIQQSSAVAVSGIQTGDAGASNVSQVIARYPFNIVPPTLTGGSTEESVNNDISNRGFTTKPDGTTGMINVANYAGMKARYDWDDGSNSSTNAVIKVSRFDGAVLPAFDVRLQGEFFQYT